MVAAVGVPDVSHLPSAVRRSEPAETTVLSCIWPRTSMTMAPAASPTDFMVMAENQYGSMAPMLGEGCGCKEMGGGGGGGIGGPGASVKARKAKAHTPPTHSRKAKVSGSSTLTPPLISKRTTRAP